MGQSSSVTSVTTRGANSLEEKLNHLRNHASDTLVTHGLLQEITNIINKNANGERDRFCDVLLQASSQAAHHHHHHAATPGGRSSAAELLTFPVTESHTPSAGGSTVGGGVGSTATGSTSSASSTSSLPFAELFQRVRVMTDAASRCSVVHWLRHITAYNEAVWVPILVQCGVVGFVEEFYDFQSNTHIPTEVLGFMAQLLASWSKYALFASAMGNADSFRSALLRVRFTQVNGKERSHLLTAMRRCYQASLMRNDSFDLLLKLVMEKDEAVEQTLVDCIEMIADAISVRHELVSVVLPRHLNVMQKLYAAGAEALVASVVRLLVTVVECEAALAVEGGGSPAQLLMGQSVMMMTASTATGAANASGATTGGKQRPPITSEAVHILASCFDVSLLDNAQILPLYLMDSIRMIMEAWCGVSERLPPPEVEGQSQLSTPPPNGLSGASFVEHFVEARYLSLLVKRITKSLQSDTACRLSRLTLFLMQEAPQLAYQVAHSGVMSTMLDALLIVADEPSMDEVVAAIALLCQKDSSVAIALCADHKFHNRMQEMNQSTQSKEEANIKIWGIVQILENLLTPEVVSHTDELLIQTVYSLLCQVLGSCELPPRRYFAAAASKPASPIFRIRSRKKRTAATVDGSASDRFESSTTGGRRGLESSISLASDAVRSPVAGENATTMTTVERIIQSSLTMLTARCFLGPSYAEYILGLVPLGVVRSLLAADHLPVVQQQAKQLTAVIANASATAKSELALYGCLTDLRLLAIAERRNERGVSLRRFQRHWKRVLFIRKLSALRTKMANTMKNGFMNRIELSYEEQQEYLQIVDAYHGNLERIHKDYSERDLLAEEYDRQAAAAGRAEAAARHVIRLLKLDDMEARLRGVLHRQDEVRERSYVSVAAGCSREEAQLRTEIRREAESTLTDTIREYEVTLQDMRVRLLRRNALLDAEHMARASTVRLEQNEFFRKIICTKELLRLVEEEGRVRATLVEDLSDKMLTFIDDELAQILVQTVDDDGKVREEVERQEAREHCHVLQAWSVQLAMLQQESVRRREWHHMQSLSFASMNQLFYTIALKQTHVDEARARASLLRSVTMQYRLAMLPKDRLLLQSQEDIRRRSLTREHRTGLHMLKEAWRSSCFVVCALEELRERQELDFAFHSFSQNNRWTLAHLQLIREEFASRNAISLQYTYIARNILGPFTSLRLVNHQYRLLQVDLEVRSGIWVEEGDSFVQLLLGEVTQMQRIHRKSIMGEQAVDHERLAQHFATVTHVARLQEQAQKFLLQDEEVRREAWMGLHGRKAGKMLFRAAADAKEERLRRLEEHRQHERGGGGGGGVGHGSYVHMAPHEAGAAKANGEGMVKKIKAATLNQTR